jgi:hypothetical protein
MHIILLILIVLGVWMVVGLMYAGIATCFRNLDIAFSDKWYAFPIWIVLTFPLSLPVIIYEWVEDRWSRD